jgi:hypothetical protein
VGSSEAGAVELSTLASLARDPLLIVSPHLDDAALSCAALLAREEALDVLTVFAAAPDPPRRGWWDAETGFADSAESVAARRREDGAAFSESPHRVRLLELLEGQYLDSPRGGADGLAIADAVAEWVGRAGGGFVAVPAGAGRSGRLDRLRRTASGAPRHPDHVFVRDAVLAALASSRATPLLYEEVPYLWGAPADREAKRVARARGLRAEPLVLRVDREAKARRLAAYASQLPHVAPEVGRLDDPALLPPVERYWRLVELA